MLQYYDKLSVSEDNISIKQEIKKLILRFLRIRAAVSYLYGKEN